MIGISGAVPVGSGKCHNDLSVRLTSVIRDDFHHVGDVAAAAEFEFDRVEVVGQVESDVGVDIEVADGFDREFHDAAVGDRDILDSLPGDALFVDEDDPTVGHDGQVTNQLVGQLNGLARREKFFELFFDAFFVDLGREPKHSGKQSHRAILSSGCDPDVDETSCRRCSIGIIDGRVMPEQP